MDNIRNIPGLQFVGMISNPQINNGAPVPLYEIKEPSKTHRINTLEGWNAYAREQNTKAFFRTFGRFPIDYDELLVWEQSGFPVPVSKGGSNGH